MVRKAAPKLAASPALVANGDEEEDEEDEDEDEEGGRVAASHSDRSHGAAMR